MKKLVSVLFAAAILFGLSVLSPIYADSWKTSGNYTYEVNSDNTASVVAYNGSEKKLTIPSSLGGYKVTSIAANAFKQNRTLTEVIIPSTVTSIGRLAFSSCSLLKTVSVPVSVIKVDELAFFNTPWYDNQPNGLMYIGRVAFEMIGACPATVTIKSGTTGITSYAFYSCKSLKTVTFPNSLKTIGKHAFFDCTSLKNVFIPNSVDDIGEEAFGYYYDEKNNTNKVDGFTISGCKGAVSEEYAKKNDISFISKGTFIAAPKITKLQNVIGGIKITQKKITGAAKYRIFRKTSGSSWKKLVDTTALTYVDKAVKSGTKYAYTIRCISKDGKKYTSSYNKTGKSLKYIAAPLNPTLKNTSTGVKATWKKINGAVKYRLFRKTAGSSWKKVGDTKGLTYLDKSAKNGVVNYYTVRCVSADGTVYTSAYRSGSKIAVPKAKTAAKTNTNSSSSNRLRSYIKKNGTATNSGAKWIGGNVSGDNYAKVTLLSNNALNLTLDRLDRYSETHVYINNIDTSKSDKADFTVLIYYGDAHLVLKTTGTVNVKTSRSSLSSNNVSISFTKTDKSYYSKSEAKHFTYSSLSKCLSVVNQYLKSKVGMSLRDVGFPSYPI